MTPEEIQEARRWSAIKMGYVVANPDYPVWLQRFAYGIFVSEWQPDRIDTGQIWLLVERMSEDGWYLSLDQSMVTPFEWTAQFFTEVHTHPVGLGVQADDPCHAIILAAMATEGTTDVRND